MNNLSLYGVVYPFIPVSGYRCETGAVAARGGSSEMVAVSERSPHRCPHTGQYTNSRLGLHNYYYSSSNMDFLLIQISVSSSSQEKLQPKSSFSKSSSLPKGSVAPRELLNSTALFSMMCNCSHSGVVYFFFIVSPPVFRYVCTRPYQLVCLAVLLR